MPSLAILPQQEFVLQVLRAARRLELEGDRLLAPHELSVAQFNILDLLRHYQPMPQSDLVRALVVGKATVSSLVGGLLKRKLVVQTANAVDRRAHTLQLSPEGTLLWHLAGPRVCPRLKEAAAHHKGRRVGGIAACLVALFARRDRRSFAKLTPLVTGSQLSKRYQLSRWRGS